MIKFVSHDDISDPIVRDRKDAIIAIFNQLQKRRKEADTTELSVAIHDIISDEVGTKPDDDLQGTRQFDISAIDFDLLRKEFAKAKHKNLLLSDIDELIRKRIDAMIHNNPLRINFYEEYQRIIQEYNAEQDRASIEKTFMALMNLSNSLNEEEKRFVREGFTNDEQLTFYDMLFDPNISKSDIGKLKKLSVELLEKVKSRIKELHNWREKDETRAQVATLIHESLFQYLPESYPLESIDQYSQKVFQYVYDRYPIVAA